MGVERILQQYQLIKGRARLVSVLAPTENSISELHKLFDLAVGLVEIIGDAL